MNWTCFAMNLIRRLIEIALIEIVSSDVSTVLIMKFDGNSLMISIGGQLCAMLPFCSWAFSGHILSPSLIASNSLSDLSCDCSTILIQINNV